MTTTTDTRPVRGDEFGNSTRTSPHKARTILVIVGVLALLAVSFFVGHVTTHHQLTTVTPGSAQVTGRQLSPADRAQLAGDVAVTPLTHLSPADRAIIADDVAPLVRVGYLSRLSPADRAIVAADDAIAPTSQISDANSTLCRSGQPC